MMKCKWAGDVNDEYCKSCDGITMQVDGNSISCTECAGYEESVEDVETTNSKDVTDTSGPIMNEPVTATKNEEKTDEKPTKPKKINNNTSATKETKIEDKNKATINKNEVSKVSEEHNFTENVSTDGIRVTSIRYTSGATVKKGDNYFKFIAEEEWDVSRIEIEDVQEAREKLWAKLNAEVDSQIEELNNMN